MCVKKCSSACLCAIGTHIAFSRRSFQFYHCLSISIIVQYCLCATEYRCVSFLLPLRIRKIFSKHWYKVARRCSKYRSKHSQFSIFGFSFIFIHSFICFAFFCSYETENEINKFDFCQKLSLNERYVVKLFYHFGENKHIDGRA